MAQIGTSLVYGEDVMGSGVSKSEKIHNLLVTEVNSIEDKI
jgi:hypothetical protein